MFKKIILTIALSLVFTTTYANDKILFTTVYNTINDNHITPVNIESLTINGLKGLSEIDKNFTIADGKDMVYMYYKRKQVALWHKPKDQNDINTWAEIADKAVKKAEKVSQKVKNYDGHVAEKVLFNAVNSLDNHSKYHYSDEIEDEIIETAIDDRSDGEFLTIKIKSFENNTANFIKKSIARHNRVKGIILDLRGNQGGQLNSAIEVAKLFIDDGIITIVKGKEGTEDKYYVAKNQKAYNYPLAVLVDAQTASSAEVLTSALKEQAQAKVIGTPTFGKSTIQDVYQFENKARLALSTGQFYSPSGKKMDKNGITPDFCIMNDRHLKNDCIKQKRENREFDIEFAKSVLTPQI